MSVPDLSRLTPTDQMRGDDDADTSLLRGMLAEARSYLESYQWCPADPETYLGFGVGGVVATFLFKFKERLRGTDDALWVVVGDLPPAYLVVDEAPDARSALEAYCELMEDWVEAVLEKKSLADIFPVYAEPTPENARMLSSRLAFLRREIIPVCDT